MSHGLGYSGEPPVLERYSNASWINNKEDLSSSSGWVFVYGGGVISWSSKKQTCISYSTMTLEFIALTSTSKKAEWLQNLMFKIILLRKLISPVGIHCDSNLALVTLIVVYYGKSRHISLNHDLVKRLIKKWVIIFDYVNTKMNLEDNFTKVLPRNSIDYTSIGIGLRPINTNEGTQSNAQLALSLMVQ